MMRHFLFVLACVCSTATAQPATLDLHEGWLLQSSAKIAADGAALSTGDVKAEEWYPTVVPRTVLAALVDNKVYPDPYFGTNMKDIPGYQNDLWLVMKQDSPFRPAWWYRTAFDVPADWKAKHVTLHFDGINMEAEVWLNGTKIADGSTMRGMFRRFEFTVDSAVKPGERNVLAVKILPPGLLPKKNYHTKQIEATTGWDDHNPQPPDGNMGIWQKVYLKAQGPVALRNPYVETKIDWSEGDNPTAERAHLTVSAYLHNMTDKETSGQLSCKIEGFTFTQAVTLAPGDNKEIIVDSKGTIGSPRLWWPHPIGPQELYTAHFEFTCDGAISDAADVRFGIREIESHLDEDHWRKYRVNKRDILIRGGAWMTADMLLRLTPERYRALVTYAREGNLNMLRSEGFSIRETDDFYDICDELGVMVTQQIFGRSIPDEKLAIDCIDDMMLRIRNHPSLAHFLGHDETFPTKTLDAAYQDLIARYRVNRTYQPHSGAFEIAGRIKTGGTRTGTRELWTYAGPEHYYRAKEYGWWGFAQSGGIGGIVSAPDTIRQIIPQDQLWPALETPAWSFHTVMQGGSYFQAVREAMKKGYGEPKDLEDFLRKAYAMNYNSARGMFEAYGRNKVRGAHGITTWKYDAAWPAAMTWHYIDWYLRATAAYHGAKKACEALHVQYAYDDAGVYVVNSLYEPSGPLDVFATIFDLSGKVLKEQKAEANVGPNGAVKVLTVEPPADVPAAYLLRLALHAPGGQLRSTNTYWLSTTPDVPTEQERYTLGGIFYTNYKSSADFTALASLPPANVSVKAAAVETAAKGERAFKVEVANTGTGIAFQTRLDVQAGAEGLEAGPVYWDDNFVTLLPGETRTLYAHMPETALNGKEPIVRVSGWNVAAASIPITGK